MFSILLTDGNMLEPCLKVGDVIVLSTGNSIEEKAIIGICFEEGTQQFAYWVEGEDSNIPESELEFV